MKTPVLDNITTPQEKEEIFKFMGTDQLVELKRTYSTDDDQLDHTVKSELTDKLRYSKNSVQHEFVDSVGNRFSVMQIFDAFDQKYYTLLMAIPFDITYGIYAWIPIETVEWLTSTDVAMEYILKEF
jgi:hypothetical protein